MFFCQQLRLRHVCVAKLVDDDAARAEDGVAWVADLRRKLEIPPLAAYGISRQDIPELAEHFVEKLSAQHGTKAPIVTPPVTTVESVLLLRSKM